MEKKWNSLGLNLGYLVTYTTISQNSILLGFLRCSFELFQSLRFLRFGRIFLCSISLVFCLRIWIFFLRFCYLFLWIVVMLCLHLSSAVIRRINVCGRALLAVHKFCICTVSQSVWLLQHKLCLCLDILKICLSILVSTLNGKRFVPHCELYELVQSYYHLLWFFRKVYS